ncbi:signal peptidase I [Enterococcus termitis]|uniref:Signal peptidase I n=1 Tax=Enterococcus termitis TaxID=332950 RepID=A0A1E5GHU8_9ENTE|nr:signal peptidase I [Enterococcus termitis]OJG98903.1 signal peptidase I [Enterococcus termitis]
MEGNLLEVANKRKIQKKKRATATKKSSGKNVKNLENKRKSPKKKTTTKKGQTKNKRNTKKKSAPIRSLIMNSLFYGVILLMVIGSLIFAVSKDQNKSFLGYRFFGVLTDSMVPRDPKTQKGGFHAGDVIIVKNIAGEDAEVGDIITFRPNINSKAFLTHRVKEKLDHLDNHEGTYYITQGDANLVEDTPVNSEQVVGKKIAVLPKIGGILNFITNNLLLSIVFLFSVFGFITVMKHYVLNK